MEKYLMMKQVNTALCSFGMSGRVFHAPFIAANPGFNLYSVWERTKNEAALKYPHIKTVRSLDEILQDEAVELVVVNTPNTTHFDYASQVLRSGKHVVVEKPFTVTSAEARSLEALASHQKRVCSVFQNRRYDSDYKTIKKVMQQNLLGDLVEVEMHFDRYKDSPGPKLHKEVAGPGSGSLYDLGSHLIDQALQLFGRPQKVFADIRVSRPFSRVVDYFEILFYYETFRIRIKSSYSVREPLPGYIFHGLKGSFIKAKTNVQEEALTAGLEPAGEDWGREPESERGLLHTIKDGSVIRELVISEQGNYGQYYQEIFEAIRLDRPLPVTAEQGRMVIEMIEAAYRSNETGKVIEL